MPIERKFNMQQRIADGGFYTGPNFSTHQEHADLTSLPDSTVFSNPTVKFVRYGLGREDVPYTQGMYNSLLGEPSFQSSEDKEKKEFPPRVNALFRRVSDALYDHYGVAVRIGGVGKEGDDVRDIDVRFLPEDQLRDFSQEYNHQEYLLSNLPPIARAALVVRGVPYAVATPTVNTIAFSEKRYLSPLKKGGKLSDQDKIEMTQSAVEMLRFLVPSIVQLLPDRHRVDKIPEPLLKMIFDPKDGELTKKLNYAIQRAGPSFAGQIMDIVGRIVEGLRDRPDTHHSSPSLVLQGAKAAFMMKDDGNEGKEIQACSMGDDAQQSISDALSVPVLTKIMTGIDKDDQFKDWFVLPETWIRAKKNQLKGRTPSRQDQTLMNKAEQIGNELGRGLSTLQNSAREGGAIIGAIVFPPYLEIGLLKDQEDTERFVFNTFKGGTLTSLLYDVPIGNKVAVERQLKKGIGKSDPEYGTFAS